MDKQALIKAMTRLEASQSGFDLWTAALVMHGRGQTAIAFEIIQTGLIANGRSKAAWPVARVFETFK